MAKKPIKPLIRALAEHIADEVMASHDAGFPKRKRLPKKFYEDELAKEDPLLNPGEGNERRKHKTERIALQSLPITDTS